MLKIMLYRVVDVLFNQVTTMTATATAITTATTITTTTNDTRMMAFWPAATALTKGAVSFYRYIFHRPLHLTVTFLTVSLPKRLCNNFYDLSSVLCLFIPPLLRATHYHRHITPPPSPHRHNVPHRHHLHRRH
jgi:hypothetical protein